MSCLLGEGRRTFWVFLAVTLASGICADSAYAEFTLSGTPWSRISSPRWRTKWVLMVLLPMPLEHGETAATWCISHCRANWDFLTCDLAIVGCFIHWCHYRRDDTTWIQSETCLSSLSGGSSSSLLLLSSSSFFRAAFFLARKMAWNAVKWGAKSFTWK